MADDFELEAEIGLDVSNAVRDARKLADALADLNDASDKTDDNIERIERSAAGAAGTLARFTKEGSRSADAALKQAKAINSAVRAYEQLYRTQGKAVANAVTSGQNPAQIALKQAGKQIEDDRQYNALVAAENRKAEAEERRHAAELQKIDQDLAAQRAAETRKSQDMVAGGRAAAIARSYQAAENAEKAAHKRDLDELRNWIQNREKLLNQAYEENAQRTLKSQVPAMNQQNFQQNFNANSLKNIRDSAAYADVLNESLRGLANQRYALYDVATSLGVVAAAMTAAGGAAIVMGGQFDKAFGQVERTTGLVGDQAAALREELIGITTELPTSFADVAGIATLGAQMNIADDALAGFTETVAAFSSATDVTVDAAATGFGRLAQLTKTPQSEISNLASAIYQTGINAVATESEILAVSQQIAVAGNLAGFTQQEIIALSSSLASLGVAPEQARGAFERIFGNFIPGAIAKGGSALQGFADMAGMSADEFAEAWETKPQEAFNAFLNGLSKVENQTLALRELGIVNVRDINVLNRLSANMDVYSQALNDTNAAYAENTALTEGVAIAQDNLIDRLTRLANSFKALLASAGQNDFLNGLVEALITATEAIRKFVDTPVGKFVAGLTVALTALTGIFFAIVAAMAMGRASLLALVVALRSNVASSNGMTLSLRALTAELLRLSPSVQKATGSMAALTTAEGRAAAGASALGLAMKGVLLSTGIGVALAVLPGIIEQVGEAFKSTEDKAKDYFEAVQGAPDFSAALAADTKTWQDTGSALGTVNTQVKQTATGMNDLGTSLQTATGGQVDLNDATTQTTDSLRKQTIAVGEQAKAVLANQLANDKTIQGLWEQRDLLEKVGFSMKEYIQATLANPGSGGQNYIKQFTADLKENSTGIGLTAVQFAQLGDAVEILQNASSAYDTELANQINQMDLQKAVMSAAGIEIENVADASDDAAGSTEDLSNAMSKLTEATFAGVTSVADIEGSLYDLGASLAENGNSFSAYSEQGRNNLQALQQTVSTMAEAAGNDTVAFGANVASMVAQLQGMGVNTGQELAFLGDMLNSLVGTEWGIDFNSAPARQDIQAFIAESIKALKTRAELERASIEVQRNAREAFNQGISQFGGMAAQFGIELHPIDTVVDTSGLNSINQAISSLEAMQNSIDTSNHSLNGGKGSMSDGFQQAANNANKAAKGTKGVGDAAKQAQKEVRTLADYANDLKSVFDRQLEIKFGNQNAKDDTANLIQDMKDKIKDAKSAITDMKVNLSDLADKLRDARQKVKDFNAEIKGLRADKTTLEYQLKVAVEYGDTLRANEIRAEIAKKNEEIKSTENERSDASKEVNSIIKEQEKLSNDLLKAQKALSAGLKGNSQASRDNRAAVQNLLQSYKDQLVQAAANGASQKELEKKAKDLRTEFSKQLTQMGLNKSEVKEYSEEFEGFTEVIKKVPRNVTVTAKAGTSAAAQAINEFIKKQNQKTITLKSKVKAPKSVSGGTYKPSRISGAAGASGGTYRPNSIVSKGNLSTKGVSTQELYATKIKSQSLVRGNKAMVASSTGGQIGYHASGGVAGLHPGAPVGTDTVPAWLTPGEWVIQKKAVDHYGTDFFASLNSMKFPTYLAQGMGGNSAGQSSSPSVQLVELMPNQVAQIVRAVQTTIKVDGQTLATSVNGSNRNNSTRGGN